MYDMNLWMKKWGLIVTIFLVIGLFSDSALAQVKVPEKTTSSILTSVDKDEEWFESLFKSYPEKFDSLIANRQKYNLQVIYTQINRGSNGIPTFQDYFFNRKSARYFYPASSINLAIASLALQKLNEKGISINSTMITETGLLGQTAQYNDPTAIDGRPTVAQYIRQLLLVNDDNAFNRLYEFLGQDYINTELAAKGYKSARVLNRMGVWLTEEENRNTNPVSFFDDTKKLIYKQPAQVGSVVIKKGVDMIRKSFYMDSVFIDSSMDFSNKNRISLEDLQKMMISIVFPEKIKAVEQFNLSIADRKFLLKYMSQLPGESLSPSYDSSYHDAYRKYIFFGGEKGIIPKQFRIFNQSGIAYGQITDVAYFVDMEKKIEFILAATINCNSNEIMNDNWYEYSKIGLPFMKDLGNILYDLEMKRKRKYLPDLSDLFFTYDK